MARQRVPDVVLARWMASAAPLVQALAFVAIETGLRRSELFALRGSQVNLEAHCLTLDDRDVPLSPFLRLFFAQPMIRDYAGEIFGPASPFVLHALLEQGRIVSVLTLWRQADRASGVRLRFSDLRFEAGYSWIERRIPSATVRYWLGERRRGDHPSITPELLARLHRGARHAAAVFLAAPASKTIH